jgi:tRNA(Ile)-lysidine synthase
LLLALREAGFSKMTAAHVNHQLRGSESDGDEAFVRGLAASLGVAFQSIRINVAKEAADENLEAAARGLRYQWLEQVSKEIGAVWIATGHTADDQAETVLHRLIRGAGLQGLRGIARRRPLAGGKLLVRPLLAVSRAEVLAYLKERGQLYRTDSSNADPRFTRNRIRGELMPLVRGFNPDAATALGRLAEQAEESHEFIEKAARELMGRIEKPRAGAMVVLDRVELAAIPRLLARELLRLIWEREGWPMGEMGFEQWERAASLSGADFPGGVAMHIRERVVQLNAERGTGNAE